MMKTRSQTLAIVSQITLARSYGFWISLLFNTQMTSDLRHFYTLSWVKSLSHSTFYLPCRKKTDREPLLKHTANWREKRKNVNGFVQSVSIFDSLAMPAKTNNNKTNILLLKSLDSRPTSYGRSLRLQELLCDVLPICNTQQDLDS